MIAPRNFCLVGDCLVTGATGLVGNNVVRQLVAQDLPVRALVREASAIGERALTGLSVTRMCGGLADESSLDKAVDGASCVVHAAAFVHCGWRHGDEMREVNVAGTRRLARAARRAGARFVHVSSVDAIGLRPDGGPADEDTPPGVMPECPYVVTKRDAERAVLEEVDRGLDAVIVNPVYMIGPWDWRPSSGRMLLEVATGKGLFAPPGGNDFVDVRDVAAGILAALERGVTGRRYILGGHGLKYLDAWGVMARVTGRMQPLGLAPRPFVSLAGWAGDLAALIRGREGDVNSAATTMSMLDHNFSCQRAREELGYSFRPIEDAVRDAWHWFLAHGYASEARRRPALAR
ncbi:MAG: NAD-dependent epimerase/dehydratase family protein [Planctomycetes bacterium]|nr:NAD-dependent epimerase/dehydratase family protein [Planctomycetota bacterium]MBM4057123.1 NAD-dependent epimerase/dehydratase family protein [Planctomycetota bacterium]